ncbi:protein UBASH3A homolog isoform X2 [Neodiprion lecontei]|uniref:Protein UBASH3A homolog isoform X2 n=1 Tax=Neodiprion lecontei TaxID=441921 RepID=A0ABM3GKQ9_NEOLC|nr:protein UBASH3A homolog isoform X2 [Neodiprion lecontei]
MRRNRPTKGGGGGEGEEYNDTRKIQGQFQVLFKDKSNSRTFPGPPDAMYTDALLSCMNILTASGPATTSAETKPPPSCPASTATSGTREKALAATGYRGLQLASDWLLAHVRDPTLDRDEPREYVLYACPTGPLAEKLLTFWTESRELGWNGAHNCMPHITLVSFFKAPDEAAGKLAGLLEDVVSLKDSPDQIGLETYISPNFMGLFIEEEYASWLKTIAVKFVNKLSSLSISAEPPKKSLHITLAYQFSESLFQPLRNMAERLGSATQANWELRLYSRDSRVGDAHVHKVTHAHVPREHDELELRPGDYIYLSERACSESIDGWVEGTSWLTGITGYLPLNHTKRTAESDAWTLHSTVQIIENRVESIEEEIPRTRKPPVLSSNESLDMPDGVPTDHEPMAASEAPQMTSRQIFICRHGERVDFTFGAWIPYCFEADGCYVRRDLNMPKDIPARNIQEFHNDCPLTTLGEIQANLVGQAMRSSNVTIDVAFASPSLRCVQTLSQILQGHGSDVQIKVEPGLIEWLAWYPNGLPVWMTPEALIKAGFDIDVNYEAVVKTESLPQRENAAQYYERSFKLIEKIIEQTKGNVLIVAHAASLAACTRQLTGGRVPPAAEVTRLVQRVPYLACLTAQQGPDGWQLHPPPFPPLTHTSNSRFDWKILT